ncbi:MAG TPA: serine hydrolase domain-containing protein, partial [Flavobacteriales bacterium]|nr:serine hydrolase domain-containing protein [Flavobacteriales bacterium]
MRKILLLSFVFLCYIGKPVIAQDTRFQLADSLFNLVQKKNRAMGSVCIRKNGKIEYQRSFGWAEALAHVRSNDSTAYRIGSISKVFTSVIIHQLIEEKKLKLDQKLGEFFPD